MDSWEKFAPSQAHDAGHIPQLQFLVGLIRSGLIKMHQADVDRAQQQQQKEKAAADKRASDEQAREAALEFSAGHSRAARVPGG
jgi:hypothetical protein